jgi:glutamyl-tRNA synthetase
MQQRPQTAAQNPIRVRFAPSPTGHLHVGGARTALFNWLLARKLGGVFVLRIEDTDAMRSTEESLRGILDGMRWLGLFWDEGPEIGGPHGPYQQTLRQVLYHAEADRLLRQGSAYRCFCTKEELDAMRAAAQRSGQPVRYDGRCRGLDPALAARRADAGEQHVVRLRMPDEGDVGWVDLVCGELRFRHSALDDFVLLKSDGNPTYNFAVVVDDVKMQISHVIRGDDHISNTPRQLVLFDALGLPRPEFAHLPMIVGRDRTRLSKRHGATSVTQFRAQGILPQAMVNYLALLGWAYDGVREVFAPEELVSYFDLRNVSRTPAVFDGRKLRWMNHEHFVRLPLGRKVEALLPQMKLHGLWPPRFRAELHATPHFRVVTGGHDDKVAATIQPIPEDEWMRSEPSLAEELPRLEQILDAVGNRLGGPHDVAEVMAYYYTDDYPYDPDAVAKHLAGDVAAAHLAALADALEALDTWTPEAIEAALRALAAARGVKAGDIIHPARVAVTGRSASPGIFTVLHLVGRPKSVERLRRGRDIVRWNRAPMSDVPAGSAAGAALAPGEPPPEPAPQGAPPADLDWDEDRPPEDA